MEYGWNADQLRMMLLMGMKSSFTRYPMPPIIAKPIAQLVAIFLNSRPSGFSHTRRKIVLSSTNFFVLLTSCSISFFIQLLIIHVHLYTHPPPTTLIHIYHPIPYLIHFALLLIQPMRQTSLFESFIQKHNQSGHLSSSKSNHSPQKEKSKPQNELKITHSEHKTADPNRSQQKSNHQEMEKQKRVSFEHCAYSEEYSPNIKRKPMDIESEEEPIKPQPKKRKMDIESDEQVYVPTRKEEVKSSHHDSDLKKKKVPKDNEAEHQTLHLQTAPTEQQFTDKTPVWALPENHRDKNGRRPGEAGYDPTTLLIPEQAFKSMTEAKRQYWKIKADNYDKIVLFKLGKFYELFYQDAAVGNREMQLKWMGTTMHVGFPEKTLDKYVQEFVLRGYKVAVVEQMETPGQMRERVKSEKEQGRKSEGTLEREVIEVVSKGTHIASDALSPQEAYLPHYLMAIAKPKDIYSYALLDITRNLILVGTCATRDELKTVLYQTRPVETLYDSDSLPAQIVVMVQTVGCQLSPLLNKDNLWHPFNAQQQLAFLNNSQITDNLHICTALAGLLKYLKKCFKYEEVMAGVKVEMYSPAQCTHMIIDSQALQHLEIFDTPLGPQHSLFHRIDHTSTAFGKRLLRKWLTQPLLNSSLILHRLDAVHYLQQNPYFRTQLINVLNKTPDLQKMVNRLYKYSAQTAASKAIYFEDVKTAKLKEFKKFMHCMFDTWRAIKPLRADPQAIPSVRLRQMFTMKNQSLPTAAIFYEDMDQSASPGMLLDIEKELIDFESYLVWEDDKPVPKKGVLTSYDSLTQEIEGAKQALEQYLDRVIRDMKVTNLKYVHTKERYEIQIAESKEGNRPKDFIFTSRRAGFSRYVSKESRRLVASLEESEERLKEQLTHFICFFFEQFRKKQHVWDQYIKVLTELDCLLSMSIYSEQCQGCRPVFPAEGYLIEGARHPCLPAHDMVANDIELCTKRVMVLTGPNMGGKSTLLRTSCLLTILAQMGSCVPAAKYECMLVDRVFTRIGASDKMEEGKSTFFIEMEETKSMVQWATPRSLLIVDELGRGTSTYDGMAIAHAVLEYFIVSSQCRCLFATHYHSLTSEFLHYPTVKQAIMDYVIKNDTLHFLYKLKGGCASHSFAVNVAKSVKINEQIIVTADRVAKTMEKQIKAKTNARILQHVFRMIE